MLRLLRHLRVLRVDPGDVLVYRFQGRMNQEHAQRVREQLEHAFPGTRAVVIDSGSDLGVVRPPLPPVAAFDDAGHPDASALSNEERDQAVPDGAQSAAPPSREEPSDA